MRLRRMLVNTSQEDFHVSDSVNAACNAGFPTLAKRPKGTSISLPTCNRSIHLGDTLRKCFLHDLCQHRWDRLVGCPNRDAVELTKVSDKL